MKARSIILLLAGATLLVAGCNKQNPFGGNYSRKAGNPVVFGVGSGNMETRTVYGDVNTSTKIQDINWVQGDKIRIYSTEADRASGGQPEHWADYTVTPVTGTLNKGTLTTVQEYGLAWGTSGTYHFYGMYPSPETEEDAVPDGANGLMGFTVPAVQLVSDEMEYAFMTAAAEVTTTADDNAVELDFYPAYTAFQFDLTADEDNVTLLTFSLQAIGDTAPALSGAFTVDWTDDSGNLLNAPVYTCTGTGKTISIADMGEEAVIGKTTPFSFKVFCLPQDLKGLKIAFTIKKSGATGTETRSLTLNKKVTNGTTTTYEPVTFAANKIHKISGTMQGTYNFKYITLTGEAIEWFAETVTDLSDEQPQASQFNISSNVHNVYEIHDENDDYKDYRQTWVLGTETARVSFKVFSPEDGTWEVIPQGETGKFKVEYLNGSTWTEVTGTFTGHIKSRQELDADETHTTTKVTFRITPNGAAAGDQIWFQTNVTDKNDVKYSIDSETQLYDMRGYHYFRIDDPVI